MFNLQKINKISISTNKLIVISSFYITAFTNFTFWSKLYHVLSGTFFENALILTTFFLLMLTIMSILMSILSSKLIIKPVIMFFIFSSSIISYFIDEFGSVISHSMIQNIVETDINEAFDLLSPGFFIHILIIGVIPSLVISIIKINSKESSQELIYRLSLIAVLIISTSISFYLSFKEVVYIGRENRDLRFYINPIYPIVAAVKYTKKVNKNNYRKLDFIFKDVQTKTIKSDGYSMLIIVVGETARASSFNLNGYQRNTTPLLNQKKILNFPNTFSCGTATAESLPCMFSDITHDDFNLDKIRHRENFLDALQNSGTSVLWRENNSGCKGVCNRVETQIMHTINNTDLCKNKECFDEVLLDGLSSYISNIKKDTVIVLHQQGSHGPAYFKRVPDEYAVFTPLCETKSVQNCTDEQVVNSYDNTILYTDYFLSEVIEILKNQNTIKNTAMIYMSDHGESLGENGVYLHGLPYFMAPVEQIHIPFIVWLSESFSNDRNIDNNCMIKKLSDRFSHDNLIHSVLGIMNISTSRYLKDKDVFSSCRPTQVSIETASDFD